VSLNAQQKRLIVTADDFGFDEAINAGVIEAHERGILTHTSLMARGPCLEQALETAAGLPRLGLGVHLTITSPTSGEPLHHGEFMRHLLRGRLTVSGVEREWRDQITSLQQRGVALTHLDSHQHLHLFPPLFPLAASLTREHGIPRMRVPFALRSAEHVRLLPRLMLSASIAASLLITRRRQLPPHAEHFYGFDISGRLTTARLVRIIESLPAGTAEIMSHPGRDNGQLNRRHGWDYHWEQELAALTSPEARAAILDNQVQLAYHEAK